jgi:hypothetical protein
MRWLLCLLVFAFAGNSWSQVLFSDNFNSAVLDTGKWSVTSFDGGWVTTGDGELTLNHPATYGQGVFVMTTAEFTSPYTVTSSFSSYPNYAINGIILRASGAYDPLIYNDPCGLMVNFYFGGVVEVQNANPTNGSILLTLPYSYDVNSWNTFSITDYGNQLDVILNGVLIIDKLPIENSHGVGKKIILADGDNLSPSMPSSKFGPITVTAVPEPSAFSLLAIGLGRLAMMRRRRS